MKEFGVIRQAGPRKMQQDVRNTEQLHMIDRVVVEIAGNKRQPRVGTPCSGRTATGNAGDLMATVGQRANDMSTDEARRAGDKDSHGRMRISGTATANRPPQFLI